MYFSKKVYTVYNGVWGKAPEAGEYSRIFVLKVTIQSVRLLLNYKLQKNWGLLPRFPCLCNSGRQMEEVPPCATPEMGASLHGLIFYTVS